MKRILALVLTLSLVVLGASPAAAQGQGHSASSQAKFRRAENAILGSYIVVLNDDLPGAEVAEVAAGLARAHGGETRHVYEHAIKGFSARMPEAAAVALSHHPLVDFVVENNLGSITATQVNPPWGLDRIDQRSGLNSSYTYTNTGRGVNAYIIDTGITPTHQEFQLPSPRAFAAYDALGGNGLDDNGHGTHVAGTIGGTTYGVAKEVTLRGVKVCNQYGGCTTEDIIEGVDWVTGYRSSPAVANMSLRIPANDALDAAVRNSINAGVSYVVGAGNEYFVDAGTYSPARVLEALTVSGTDRSDRRGSFSFGSVVDVFAPGVGITSAWYSSNTATGTFSGTSMATPHVAGVVAQYRQTNPNDPPHIVAGVIRRNATRGVVSDPGSGTTTRLLYSNFLMSVSRPTGTVPFLRYFNPETGDHFYTTRYTELREAAQGYSFEWAEGYIRSASASGTVALYRYWNPTTWDHFYTTNFNELGYGALGYSYEKVEGYVYSQQQTGTVPLYRYYNPSTGHHFYTTDYSEYGGGRDGFQFEWIQCYIFRSS